MATVDGTRSKVQRMLVEGCGVDVLARDGLPVTRGTTRVAR